MTNASKRSRVASALADAGQSEPPATPPQARTRASPKPSAETEALRALRKLRQLREKYEAEVKAHGEKIAGLQFEANSARKELSDGAREILAKLDPGTNGDAKGAT